MVKESVFRSVIYFFEDIGIYDVVLPFILIFTIVYAVLEKTKVLGSEDIDGVKYSRRNLNAMTAFVISFLVIASSKLVATINKAMSNVVLLLLLAVSFLLLVGSFMKEEKDGVFLEGWSKGLFMAIMTVGTILVFLNAITTKNGEPWLTWFWDYLGGQWSTNFIAAIILVIVVVLFMYFVVKEPKKAAKKKED